MYEMFIIVKPPAGAIWCVNSLSGLRVEIICKVVLEMIVDGGLPHGGAVNLVPCRSARWRSWRYMKDHIMSHNFDCM